MEFTGERYVPKVDGEIKYEHLHRYGLCLEFVKSKSVLDIASGEGYGSALLAKVAQSVVGVDISQEAVEYAIIEYSNYENLTFLVGSCESIPLADNSVDVVTSFETIEHHDKHEEMMCEIKRVLKPDGVLIISSPNRLTYSDERNYSNPFHVKELYYDELVTLLKGYFANFQIYGQKIATASFVFPLEDTEETFFKSYTGNMNNLSLSRKVCNLDSPFYFIVVCSDKIDNIQSKINSIYIDRDDDLLKTIESRWHGQFNQIQQKLQVKLEEVSEKLEHYELQMQQIQKELELSKSKLQQTQSELEVSQSQLQQNQSELELAQSNLQKKQSELEQSQSEIQKKNNEINGYKEKIKMIKNRDIWGIIKAWFKLVIITKLNRRK